MAEEAYSWVFVDCVPLIYEKRRVAKQFQVETWLKLAQIIKELGIEKLAQNKPSQSQACYVV